MRLPPGRPRPSRTSRTSAGTRRSPTSTRGVCPRGRGVGEGEAASRPRRPRCARRARRCFPAPPPPGRRSSSSRPPAARRRGGASPRPRWWRSSRRGLARAGGPSRWTSSRCDDAGTRHTGQKIKSVIFHKNSTLLASAGHRRSRSPPSPPLPPYLYPLRSTPPFLLSSLRSSLPSFLLSCRRPSRPPRLQRLQSPRPSRNPRKRAARLSKKTTGTRRAHPTFVANAPSFLIVAGPSAFASSAHRSGPRSAS